MRARSACCRQQNGPLHSIEKNPCGDQVRTRATDSVGVLSRSHDGNRTLNPRAADGKAIEEPTRITPGDAPASGSAVCSHVPLAALGQERRPRASRTSWRRPSCGDGRACKRGRTRETPLPQKGGWTSAVTYRSNGKKRSVSTTGCQVWNRLTARGTNAADFPNRSPQDARGTTTVARVDLPFRRDYLLRVDAPFLNGAIDRPGTTSAQGFSDLAVTLGGGPITRPNMPSSSACSTTMPTASETGLGLGKYTVGPTRYCSICPQYLFLSGFTQQLPSAAISRKSVIFQSHCTNQFVWAERWWTIAQAVWQSIGNGARKAVCP
jgi:hypothetical protein